MVTRTLLCILFSMVVGLPVQASDGRESERWQDSGARVDTTDSTRAGENEPEPAWHEAAWNDIAMIDGVHFSYIYYAAADQLNDGVVVKLENRRQRAMNVAFTIIFRSPGAEVEDRFDTVLRPGEMKTGENDGLYWIPFGPGDSIGEVGLRGVDVVAADAEGTD
ncbi:hypothetical protein [Longibacter sp.]|uniref:hypothetical protein n=1 Tax=Longibacter sp. TaxID=2045415 RepID=UPI003EBF55FE